MPAFIKPEPIEDDSAMSGIAPFIKQEPSDSDFDAAPLFVSSARLEEDEPLFIESETTLQRATKTDGRSSATVCFREPHLSHPHHHRLICGHDIVTSAIEGCGMNCLPSRDEKPTGRGFECPHPSCTRRAGHFIRRQGALKPRTCTLSHVYGLDAQADQDRVDEKMKMQQIASERIGTRSGRVMLPKSMTGLRKRSPSPLAPKDNTVQAVKKFGDVDVGAELNREFQNDPALKSVMAMTGGRPRANSLFKTDSQIAGDAKMVLLNQEMGNQQLSTEEVQKKKKRVILPLKRRGNFDPSLKADGAAFVQADLEPASSLTINCRACTKLLHGERYHCFDCGDFDICWQCFENVTHNHASHHRMKALKGVQIEAKESQTKIQETFCVCGTTDILHLVLCVDCRDAFHPGCIGLGDRQQDKYAVGQASRVELIKLDFLSWRGGKVFRCKSCTALMPPPDVKTKREIRLIARTEKRRENTLAGTPTSSRTPRSKKRVAEKVIDKGQNKNVKRSLLADLRGAHSGVIPTLPPRPSHILDKKQVRKEQRSLADLKDAKPTPTGIFTLPLRPGWAPT